MSLIEKNNRESKQNLVTAAIQSLFCVLEMRLGFLVTLNRAHQEGNPTSMQYYIQYYIYMYVEQSHNCTVDVGHCAVVIAKSKIFRGCRISG